MATLVNGRVDFRDTGFQPVRKISGRRIDVSNPFNVTSTGWKPVSLIELVSPGKFGHAHVMERLYEKPGHLSEF